MSDPSSNKPPTIANFLAVVFGGSALVLLGIAILVMTFGFLYGHVCGYGSCARRGGSLIAGLFVFLPSIFAAVSVPAVLASVCLAVANEIAGAKGSTGKRIFIAGGACVMVGAICFVLYALLLKPDELYARCASPDVKAQIAAILDRQDFSVSTTRKGCVASHDGFTLEYEVDGTGKICMRQEQKVAPICPH
jgi:hypothetical protein